MSQSGFPISLTYLRHDCFFLESDQYRFVFDYWTEPRGLKGEMLRYLELHPMPTVVLVSHHHKDHYSSSIFEWKGVLPDIHYILSKDTARFARHYLNPNSLYSGPLKTDPSLVTILRPGDVYNPAGYQVYAFGSTDIGNSYLLEVAGLRIFHAGDLNAWTLREQNTRAQAEAAIRDFRQCLEPIKSHTHCIDLAMFPLDPRTGTGWLDGAEIFLQEFEVKRFVPMHFCLSETDEQQQEYYAAVQQALAELSLKYPTTEFIPLITPFSTLRINSY